MRQTATLVFDIGKTTKKALLFDRSFHVLEEETEHFAEILDDEGFAGEDLVTLSVWVKEIILRFLNNPRYDITHLNFSAYGASLVCLDKNDSLLLPFYNYLKPFPELCKTEFDALYNGAQHVCLSTSSPWLGMLNSGLQLFKMKRINPKAYEKVRTTLHFPQYFPFLLTGKKFSEITSAGCHTLMWDFEKADYHAWVKREQFNSLFPPMMRPDHAFDFTLENKHVKIGIGVHDSSAALMPYHVSMRDPFLLLSTGTWNITFNPFNQEPLREIELAHDCLCYLTYQGKPVKASRIFLGHEHEVQQKALAAFFGKGPQDYTHVAFDKNIYYELVSDGSETKNFYPMAMEGTGPIPEKPVHKTDFSAFRNFEEAQHQLVRFLAIWQKISVNLVDPKNHVKDIIVVGGFTKNSLFLEALQREMPNKRILTSDHPRASALGAAWLVSGDVSSANDKLLKIQPIH